ncbi:hypothetical protein C7974DRAFT_18921 [Boeremia exigua]|uniref:uncharacterized protein n=1 Tax=Boeremia exigua TaxID=749465 RepID=UPI001E8D58B2|nr:uncharacterized protein C7974DRAFT_18921 [Boeremia exigua]KAH6644354.1 hypothetical protein C7974DRAFT_18921 [Boeremia exigua]
MASSSRCSRRNRRDRLSISVLPDQLCDPEPRFPYLHWLFGENSEEDVFSRLADSSSSDTEDNTDSHTANTIIMKEVAAWLALRENDEFWVSRRTNPQETLPTVSQLLARLKHSDCPPPNSLPGTEAFNALIHAIALQLLASCYTPLPSSSSTHLPLFQQKPRKTPVSALRAHAASRFSPAAGHHARAPSETAAWPGLCTGPGPEDALAEAVSRRRRSARSSAFVPGVTASGWTDGGQDVRRGSMVAAGEGWEVRSRSGVVSWPMRSGTWILRVLCCRKEEGGSSVD